MTKYYDYDKVRTIEQREDPRGLAHQMAERALNFLAALKKPTMRIGEKRAQRKANPDFVAPEKQGVNRFEQLNKEDRWSRTEYQGTDTDGRASITVQDPRDPDDLECSPITNTKPGKHRVGGEHGESRQHQPEKVSKLVMIEEEEKCI